MAFVRLTGLIANSSDVEPLIPALSQGCCEIICGKVMVKKMMENEVTTCHRREASMAFAILRRRLIRRFPVASKLLTARVFMYAMTNIIIDRIPTMQNGITEGIRPNILPYGPNGRIRQ